MPKSTLPATRKTTIARVNTHDLKVNPVAQREFRPSWAETILNHWDINKFQRPFVNRRADGSLYIIEGQHGTWAYREHYGAGDDLAIEVELYDGLTEAEEAEAFLALNNKKPVDALSKFKVAVTAGRPNECRIDKIVRDNGCHITANCSTPGAITAVGAVAKIYANHGPETLAMTIRVLRNAFGDGGYERANLLAVADVIARYNVDEVALTAALVKVPRGSKGLAQQAAALRDAYGCSVPEATAAAIVMVYNKGKRGRARLSSWWRPEAAAA